MPHLPSARRIATGFAGLAFLAGVAVSGGAAHADGVVGPPDSPGPISTSTADGQLQISWQAPAEHGSAVTGYEVDRSTDDQETWKQVATTTDTSVSTSPVPTGAIVYFRVIAESAAGPSDPNAIGLSSPGTRTQQFKIVTAEGGPVTGANTITWSDGYGTWSTRLSLSPDGTVSIPNAATTYGALLRLSEGQYPGGNLVVSHEWSVDLGTDTQTLVVPDPPAMARRTVHLAMPDGTPVGGTEVDGDYQALVLDTEQDGYTYAYYAPDGSMPDWTRTNSDGTATITGWPTEDVDWVDPPPMWPNEAVHVNYDDGTLRQSGDFPLTGDDTTITMNPMPYLSSTPPATTTAGRVGAVDFAVHPAPTEAAAASTLAGVHVTLTPPTGWTSSRCATKSVLAGVSDSHGHVHLKVCGAVTGAFTVRSSGAVSTAAVTMRVWHGAPAAPAALAATSTKPGALKLSWTPPSYTGGAAVTGYTITLGAPGQKARTVTVPAKTLTRTFTGLARAMRWRATVRAVTKYHAGSVVVHSAWVG